MPLVLMCGFPCSGKSTRTEELSKYLTEIQDKVVHIVSDHTIGVDRNDVFSDSKKEKEVRGTLKSTIQRKISKEDVVILDSHNYIKGFRYELFCVTKGAQTPHCVIHCDTNTETCSKWNQDRKEEEQYSKEVLDALFVRFEPPDSRNRWDAPLFTIQVDDKLPCEDIYNSLYQRKAPPPNQSTQSQPLSSTNFLYELDRITQDTINVMVDAQKTSVPGDKIAIPGAKEKIDLIRHVTLAELQRIRRQFIAYSKMHPVEDTGKISNMFVQFLNNSLSR